MLSHAPLESQPIPFDLMRQLTYLPLYERDKILAKEGEHFHSSMHFNDPLGAGISIHVSWTKNPGQKKYVSEALGTIEGEKLRLSRFNTFVPGRGTFSGFDPKFSGYKRDKDGVFFYSDSTWASVYCRWTPPLYDNGTQYWDPAPFDAEAKSAFVEKVARHTLIRAAGLRLDPVESNNSSQSAKCRLTQAKFGDLTKWAELNGWKIGDENEYGIITLKKGDVEAILPLGADQIKVKGAWKEMGDSAAFFNGKLYLPEAGLKHLKGA